MRRMKLDEKLETQKIVRAKKKKSEELRYNLYKAQDDIDDQEDKLIEETPARLHQQKEEEILTHSVNYC